ncbi:hypothetical protein Hdeb2414_s0026g00681471 [Helianthus debilis subsp. tardiflorus]
MSNLSLSLHLLYQTYIYHPLLSLLLTLISPSSLSSQHSPLPSSKTQLDLPSHSHHHHLETKLICCPIPRS